MFRFHFKDGLFRFIKSCVSCNSRNQEIIDLEKNPYHPDLDENPFYKQHCVCCGQEEIRAGLSLDKVKRALFYVFDVIDAKGQ